MEGLVWNIDTVASVIDVAVAPVFLLAGISGLLMVLTNRLGRTIDRSRSLQAAEANVKSAQHIQTIHREKANLMRRMHLNHFAISMAVLSAILVCLVVVTLFLGSLLQLNVSVAIASLATQLAGAPLSEGVLWNVCTPIALWLVAGYFTIVRFLSYLDLRIRREGWELELSLRAEADRLADGSIR